MDHEASVRGKKKEEGSNVMKVVSKSGWGVSSGVPSCRESPDGVGEYEARRSKGERGVGVKSSRVSKYPMKRVHDRKSES